MSNETDSLLPPSSYNPSNSLKAATKSNDTWSNDGIHLKTYTAGEDASRLAAAAKALGLAKHRAARRQVRDVGHSFEFETLNRVLPIIIGEEDSPPDESRHSIWMTIAGVAGNTLEWYDFAVFGYFGDVIGQVFFPPDQVGNAATVESFAVFGGAFVMRPVGGLLLGYLGDVYGRKQALTTSIFLMAFPTFIMGCLPSFDQVGYLSTVLLILIRLAQGVSVGGQLMSSLVFTLENVPHEQWGLYGSFVWATANFGVLLGGLVGYAVRSHFSYEQLVQYAWRIPFLAGIIVSVAGFYLRWSEIEKEEDPENTGRVSMEQSSDLSMDDEGKTLPSKDFEIDGATEKETGICRKKTKKNPFTIVFSPENLRPLLASAMVPTLWSAGFYLSFVWMAIFMTDLSDHPVPGAFAVNSAALFLSVCLLFPIAGWLSDRYGRRTIMSIGGASVALLSPGLIRAIGRGHIWASFLSQMILGVSLSFWGSPMSAWLVESFEPEARLTSVAVGYNMAHALVGGSTPALATYLVDAVGPMSPGWIYTVVACIAMTGLWIAAPPSPPHK